MLDSWQGIQPQLAHGPGLRSQVPNLWTTRIGLMFRFAALGVTAGTTPTTTRDRRRR